MNDIRTYLVNLPTRVPGMLTVDENGKPIIYLNARLSSVQHRLTYDHELEHLEHDDLNNDDPIELVEARASGKIPNKAPDKTPISQLVTGLPDQPGKPSAIDKNRTYYYPPVKIKRDHACTKDLRKRPRLTIWNKPGPCRCPVIIGGGE